MDRHRGRSGPRGQDVQEPARAGRLSYCRRIYGHGVRLTFELPRIGRTLSAAGDVVAENMVFGVEAILARDGVGAAFFEDIIIIGEESNELITNTPLYWW